MPKQSRLRPLGVLENIVAAYNEEGRMSFSVMAEIAGKITIGSVERALASLQRRHPLLAVGICKGDGGLRTFVQSAKPIPLTVSRSDETDWRNIAAIELQTRFDVETGPLMRVVVIPDANGAKFVFTFHHSISDGISAVFLVRDLAEALGDFPLQNFRKAESIDDWLGNPGEHGGTIQPLSQQIATDGWIRWAADLTLTPQISVLGLSKQLTAELKQRARLHQTTVHAALMVATTRAVSQIRNTVGPLRVFSPVNQRQLLGGRDQCGLFISVAVTELETGANEFWAAARAAHQQLQPYRSKQALDGFVEAVANFSQSDDSGVGARRFLSAAMDYDIVLSNLGLLPIDERYGDVTIVSLIGPILLNAVQGEQVFGVTTFRDEMRLAYTSVLPLDGLLECLQQQLQKACA